MSSKKKQLRRRKQYLEFLQEGIDVLAAEKSGDSRKVVVDRAINTMLIAIRIRLAELEDWKNEE